MRPGGVRTERKLNSHPGLPAEVSLLVGHERQVAAILDSLRRPRGAVARSGRLRQDPANAAGCVAGRWQFW
jgi:hypothetical protein